MSVRDSPDPGSTPDMRTTKKSSAGPSVSVCGMPGTEPEMTAGAETERSRCACRSVGLASMEQAFQQRVRTSLYFRWAVACFFVLAVACIASLPQVGWCVVHSGLDSGTCRHIHMLSTFHRSPSPSPARASQLLYIVPPPLHSCTPVQQEIACSPRRLGGYSTSRTPAIDSHRDGDLGRGA